MPPYNDWSATQRSILACVFSGSGRTRDSRSQQRAVGGRFARPGSETRSSVKCNRLGDKRRGAAPAHPMRPSGVISGGGGGISPFCPRAPLAAEARRGKPITRGPLVDGRRESLPRMPSDRSVRSNCVRPVAGLFPWVSTRHRLPSWRGESPFPFFGTFPSLGIDGPIIWEGKVRCGL